MGHASSPDNGNAQHAAVVTIAILTAILFLPKILKELNPNPGLAAS
jgi:hypothetical protein